MVFDDRLPLQQPVYTTYEANVQFCDKLKCGWEKSLFTGYFNATNLDNCAGLCIKNTLVVILTKPSLFLPPPPLPPGGTAPSTRSLKWSQYTTAPTAGNQPEEEETRTREKRWEFVDLKVSFKLTQTIFRDNVQDVWKSLVTSYDDSGKKRQFISQRKYARAL